MALALPLATLKIFGLIVFVSMTCVLCILDEIPRKKNMTSGPNDDRDQQSNLMQKHIALVNGSVLELHRARCSFYDRLILLDGGTLTLLVTGVSALVASKHYVQEPHRLMWGCWLLIASIVACLIHNHSNINSLILAFNSNRELSLLIDLNSRNQANLVEYTRLLLQPKKIPTTESINKSRARAIYVEWVSNIVGLSAQLMTVLAYIELVLALRSTVLSFVS
jgi:hypothetical protein